MDRQNEIECKVLGAILWREYLVSRIGFLHEDDFIFAEHRVIWGAIKELAKNGKPINPATLYLRIKDPVDVQYWKYTPGEYLASLVDHVAGLSYIAGSIVDYAKELKTEAIKRSSTERTPEDILRMADELRSMESEGGNLNSLKTLLHEEINNLQGGKQDTGLKTGFPAVDGIIGGMRNGDLIVLAGRSSSGKTTLALNIACNVVRETLFPVLFINLEMSSQMIVRKILAKHTTITSEQINKGLNEFEIKKLMSFGELVSVGDFPLDIYDRGSINVAEVAELLKPNKYKLIVIDQLTKVKSSIKRDRFDLVIADITFALKEMAKQYQVPIMLLHQINREVEKRGDRRPMLSDLRDSGAIEQDADVVIFVHREAIYTGNNEDRTALFRIAKNKMGATGNISAEFNGAFSEFVEAKKQEG